MLPSLWRGSHRDARHADRQMTIAASAKASTFVKAAVDRTARQALTLVLVCISLSAQAPATPGDVLPGATPREVEEFRIGQEDFRAIEEASEGLGPLFNGTGCASCHNVPVIGGGSPMTEMRAGALDADGNFRVVGGTTLYQMFSIPDHRCQASIPAEATIVARRMSIPLFGTGLIEAIPDETLLALEDPFD